MGFSIIKQNDNITYNVTEIVVDNVSELDAIDVSSWGAGSTALCLGDETEVYMLNSEKEWKKL